MMKNKKKLYLMGKYKEILIIYHHIKNYYVNKLYNNAFIKLHGLKNIYKKKIKTTNNYYYFYKKYMIDTKLYNNYYLEVKKQQYINLVKQLNILHICRKKINILKKNKMFLEFLKLYRKNTDKKNDGDDDKKDKKNDSKDNEEDEKSDGDDDEKDKENDGDDNEKNKKNNGNGDEKDENKKIQLDKIINEINIKLKKLKNEIYVYIRNRNKVNYYSDKKKYVYNFEYYKEILNIYKKTHNVLVGKKIKDKKIHNIYIFFKNKHNKLLKIKKNRIAKKLEYNKINKKKLENEKELIFLYDDEVRKDVHNIIKIKTNQFIREKIIRDRKIMNSVKFKKALLWHLKEYGIVTDTEINNEVNIKRVKKMLRKKNAYKYDVVRPEIVSTSEINTINEIVGRYLCDLNIFVFSYNYNILTDEIDKNNIINKYVISKKIVILIFLYISLIYTKHCKDDNINNSINYNIKKLIGKIKKMYYRYFIDIGDSLKIPGSWKEYNNTNINAVYNSILTTTQVNMTLNSSDINKLMIKNKIQYLKINDVVEFESNDNIVDTESNIIYHITYQIKNKNRRLFFANENRKILKSITLRFLIKQLLKEKKKRDISKKELNQEMRYRRTNKQIAKYLLNYVQTNWLVLQKKNKFNCLYLHFLRSKRTSGYIFKYTIKHVSYFNNSEYYKHKNNKLMYMKNLNKTFTAWKMLPRLQKDRLVMDWVNTDKYWNKIIVK